MAIVKISDLPLVDSPVEGTDLFVVVQDNVTKKAYASDIQTYVGFEEVQVATAGQTVFNLTTMTYAAGANNLMVFVDGVNQYEGSSYVETDNNTVTFTQGLHEGALVKFSTVQTQTSSIAYANAVVYNPAGIGAVPTTVQAKLRETVSVKDFGGVSDAKYDLNVSISSGSTTLTSTAGLFTSADVGKRIIVWGAGSGTNSLVATISSYSNPNSVTLNTAASTSVTNVQAQWGTDNHAAFINAASYLYGIGGGTLVAQGFYFICNGPDGDADQSQHNVAIQYCSNITFDFSSGGIYGTISFNTSNGSATVKNYNVQVLNGTFRAVGDRIEAPSSSTVWNNMTFIYAENVKVSGVTVYVPAGSRAITFQSNNLIGTDATKLKNIVLDDFIIIGPDKSAVQYLSDGIDLLTGDANGIYDGITVSNGIISNVGRGLATQNPGGSGAYKNNQLMLSNLQFLDIRATGMHVADVFGLMVDNVRIVLNPDPASSYVYEGRGFTSYNCVTIGNINNLSVLGVDTAGLQVAVAAAQVGSAAAEYSFSDIYLGVDGTSNKWSVGMFMNSSDYVINNATIANCTTGLDASSTQRGAIDGLITRDNTADFGAQIVIDRRARKINVSNYRDFDSGQFPTPVSFDGVVASGRLRYSTVPIGSVAYSSMGSDTVQVAGTLYIADLAIPRSMTITGIGVLNGSTVGTDKVIYGLYSDVGILLATTDLAGTTTAGANAFQEIALTAPVYVHGPARFAIVVQCNGTTDKIRKIAANTFIDVMTQDETGVFGTIQNISYDNTFTAGVGPIAYVY